MNDELKSKSQKKRDADALQQLGLALCELNSEQLATIPLTDVLREAIVAAKTIKSHGAIRRQAQLIGKLMRAADSESIQAAYQTLIAEKQAQTHHFHQIEQWRQRLLTEGNVALTEFVHTYQSTDVQQLRHYIKKAREEQIQLHPTGASKALFRYLRTIMQ